MPTSPGFQGQRIARGGSSCLQQQPHAHRGERADFLPALEKMGASAQVPPLLRSSLRHPATRPARRETMIHPPDIVTSCPVPASLCDPAVWPWTQPVDATGSLSVSLAYQPCCCSCITYLPGSRTLSSTSSGLCSTGGRTVERAELQRSCQGMTAPRSTARQIAQRTATRARDSFCLVRMAGTCCSVGT